MMRLRNLLPRFRDARSGDTTDPLGLDEEPEEDLEEELAVIEDNSIWLSDLAERLNGPAPTLQDLAPPPLEYVEPRGAVHNRQDIYEGGRRCIVPGCGVPSVADVCSRCASGGNVPDVHPRHGFEGGPDSAA